jgi:predicted RNase H-like HicB family nuclease
MKDEQVTLQAQVHCEEGMYWAEVPSYPGLFASGETLDELQEAIVEAWLLYTQDDIASAHIEQIGPAKPKKVQKVAPREVLGRVDQLRLRVPA